MKNLVSSGRFDNLEQLQKAINNTLVTIGAYRKLHPSEVIVSNGPMLLNLSVQKLSDQSTVMNIDIKPMHKHLVKREDS